MTVEGDVGPISVERAKDAGALVSDFTIEEARWIEPASRLGIGCEFHLLVRGEVDRGISVNIVVGAAAETEASCQGVASVRHGPIEDDAISSTKPKWYAHKPLFGALQDPKGEQMNSFNAV